MLSFKCTDIGMNCPFETTAINEEEMMKKIAKHARNMHNIMALTPDMTAKIKKALGK
jgi:predicted small metal-binding protein